MKFKCIFFDFDGVVIENSQILAFKVLHNELKNYSIQINLDYLINHCLGMNGEQVIKFFKFNLGIEIPTEIIITVRKTYKERLITQARLGKNLLSLLKITSERFICSSNNLFFINTLLTLKNIKNYFPDESIISADEVSKIKPLPDVYLKALERTSAQKDKCCAIEDSSIGVLAAKTAGLYCIGYVGNLPPAAQKKQTEILIHSGADKIISDFSKCIS